MRGIQRWFLLVPLLIGLAAVPVEVAQADSGGVASAESAAAIQREIDRLKEWVAKQHGKLGVAVLDLESGRLLAQANSTRALNPASNAKLLTAAAALARLGSEYRYTTGIYGTWRDGEVSDLVLRGHGDPSLQSADLERLCRTMVEMGLKRVKGKILVDQSRFDDKFVPPAFDQQPNEWASFRAPVSAIAVDRNTVTMNVLPGAPKQPARVWFTPPGFVKIVGQVDTRSKGSGQAIQLDLQAESTGLEARVGGHLAAGLPRERFTRRVDDPTLLPGFVLRYYLRDLGVEVGGGVARGGASSRKRIVMHESERLGALLAELGKESDNFYAEMIFKSLGAPQDDGPATSARAAGVVLDWLRSVGAVDPGTKVTNGSGLFDANRVSPQSVVRVLASAFRNPAMGSEFVAQLAIGGVDGTLRWRFREYREQRLVRAKTGTLATVDALSGYVLSPAGRPAVAFSLLVNGPRNHRESRRRMDRVVAAIAARVAPRSTE